MSVPATGPVWNVEEFPSSYNGTPIEWDPEQFDTAAMPFIVAVRQHFWSWRITRFGVGTGVLEIDVALPSAMPDGATMISFDTGDVDPSDLVGEIGALLTAMGCYLLDQPWTYTLRTSDGTREEIFQGMFGGLETDS